jgi:hypothetical protein
MLLAFLWAIYIYIEVREGIDTLLWNPKEVSSTSSQDPTLGVLPTYTIIVKGLDFPDRVTWVGPTLRIALRDFGRHRPPLLSAWSMDHVCVLIRKAIYYNKDALGGVLKCVSS